MGSVLVGQIAADRHGPILHDAILKQGIITFKMKTIKHVSLMLLLLGLPAAVQAQFTFTTNADDTITITGYTGSGGVVVIPDTTNGYPVTGIGDNAFESDDRLTNITLPYGLTSIGIWSFEGCVNLTGFILPDTVTNIGPGAFNSCTSLTNVIIPASVASIGDYAFIYCTSLTNIAVDGANPAYSSLDGVLFSKDKTTLVQYPSGKTGNYAIPDGVTNLADEAFGLDDHDQYPFPYDACAGLTNLSIPGSLVNLGAHAFSHCSGLASVTLANGVASIGTNAFSFCANLTNITMPGSVTSIGETAFFYSGLTSVTIPGSVTNFGLGAFAVCTSLTNVTLLNGVSSIGPQGFNFCTALANITIPGSVTSIGEMAFYFCSGLTNAIISASVTNMGNYAFSGCASLLDIEVSTDNLYYRSVDGVLYDEAETTLLQFPGGRGGSYLVPEGVTTIGDYAFASYDPSGSYYLQYPVACLELTNLTMAATVTSIGQGNFDGLMNLASLHFEGDAPVNFEDVPPAPLYILPGADWDGFLGYLEYWLPAMQTTAASLTGPTNPFGFSINWARGETVVVDACTNLFNPDWQPVQTNTLTTGSANFIDPQWTSYPGRFYRLRSP
jgi:hypothetical protein